MKPLRLFLMLYFFLFSIILLLGESQPSPEKVFPEIFFLNNGDKIIGSLEKIEEGNLIVKSENFEEIKIPWDKLVGIQSSRPLYFRLENGNIIAAEAQGISDGKQVLSSPLLGKIFLEKEQILMMGLSEESVRPDYHPVVWSGYLQINFSGSQGNKNSMTFVGTAHVERKGAFDKFIAQLDTRYGETEDVLDAEEISGFLRENIDITERFYIYARFEGRYDKIKGIDLEIEGELGGGLHLIKEGDFHVFEDKINLDWDLGAAYTYIVYDTGKYDRSIGMVTRVIYNHIFSNKWHLSITGEYLQNFEKPQSRANAGDLSSYRLKGEILLEIPVSKVIAFTASLRDEYDNVPAPGKKRNDLYWLIGLKLNF